MPGPTYRDSLPALKPSAPPNNIDNNDKIDNDNNKQQKKQEGQKMTMTTATTNNNNDDDSSDNKDHNNNHKTIIIIINAICMAQVRKMQQKRQVNCYRLSVASVMKNVFSRLRNMDSDMQMQLADCSTRPDR